jgi:membrane fusion protein (multidrug efflux system)
VTVADESNQSGQQQGDEQKPGTQTAQITGTVQIQTKDDGAKGKPGGEKGKPEDKDKDKDKQDPPEKKSGRKFIIIGVVLLLVLGAAFFYWRSTFTEGTDDAQVDGNLYQVSARVTGQVVKVNVEDNQKVHQGDVLAVIDPSDYQVALEQAEANLANAQAAYTQAVVNVPITSTSVSTTLTNSGSDVTGQEAQVAQAQRQTAAAAARVEQMKANATKAQLDVDRYTPLVAKDVISKQQYDAAIATAVGSNAALMESQASLNAQQDAVRQASERLQQAINQQKEAKKNGPQQVRVQQAHANAAEADIKQAQAKVDQAKLNLTYTRIVAPVDGIVNKKNVEIGGNLSVGQDLLTIIPLTNLWVTANYKETQLSHMKPGQDVTIKVDALSGRTFHGKVTQIGGATGSRLSLFPPENATGNYVKVVQRIPVRIDFTDLKKENGDYALRPGMSVDPEVDIK